LEQQRNGLLSGRTDNGKRERATKRIGFENKTGGFSINDARSKSKGVAIRPALPSLRRTGTNGIRELTDIRALRFVKRDCHRPKQWLVHGTCVMCVRSDEGRPSRESGIASVGTGRDAVVVFLRRRRGAYV